MSISAGTVPNVGLPAVVQFLILVRYASHQIAMPIKYC
jgi:hypothetical protein